MPVIALVGLATLVLVGCSNGPSEVPSFDRTNAPGYGRTEFKDVAPANANVAAEAFPMEFVDSEGKQVDLARHIGKKKVVLVVLRGIPMRDSPGSPKGKVCPSCVTQAGSLLANRQSFDERGAEVLVVFPGPAEQLGELLVRATESARPQTVRETKWPFRVLLDRNCEACDRLGIRDDLAKPSTYIFDIHGRVVYAYVGVTSTDRPSVRAILEQLEKAD